MIIVGVLAVLSVGALIVAVVGSMRAASARHELERLATHDSLTGLRNRVAFTEIISGVLPSGRGAVLCIALDRFAGVNDTYGHDVGDHLMRAVARQIEKVLRPDESVYRFGGPQFILWCPSATTAAAAVERAEQIQQVVHVQYRIEHDVLRVSASVGVVMIDGSRHGTAPMVLDDAEAALSAARSDGPAQAVVFDPSIDYRTSVIDPQGRLRDALARGELRLQYLPVVTVADSKLVGVEALLRWDDPERGVIGAREIFDLLDETDLLPQVGDWVIEEASRQSRVWQDAHPERDLVVTINVSPQQLADADFIPRLTRILEQTKADPERICLEVTEGTRPAVVDLMWRALRDAKAAGVQVALDDFGTGFSTFEFLRSFELDVLKIDRVFIERINRSEADYAIVQQLIGLAHSLDFVAIAEGVDRRAQLEGLIAADCDLAQGYYWSPPVSAEEVDALLARGVVRPAVV